MDKSIKESSIYIGHGSPTTAVEKGKFQNDLKKFGLENNNFSSIVVVSAHWQQYLPIQIISSNNPGIIYDFYGFPEEMYHLQYPVLGNRNLAIKILDLLSKKGFKAILNPDQGFDHGTWVPLKLMYPEARIPVVQISLPVPRDPITLFNVGKALAPLRNEGILLMGSGNLTHNIPYAFRQMQVKGINNFNDFPFVDDWAKETDEWIKHKLDNLDIADLLKSPDKAPNFHLAAPTTEHYDPLYFILGTLQNNEVIRHFHESFQGGSFSMRSFSLVS